MKLILQIILSISVLGLNAQTFSDVSYTVNPDPVANPERGFYHQVEDFDSETLQSFKKKGVRLILKNYSLEGYNHKALPAGLIEGVKHDFDIVRANGFKIIVRFAYKFAQTNPYGDAPLDIVLLHIEQLKKVLRDNSDIILTLQAGFIGTWGEWYYTDYFSESPGVISEQNWKDRRTVVNALLDVMPNDRMIQLRTPTFKKKMAELSDWNPLTLDEAYTGSIKARLAFHNDCFVASNTDWGTYNDISVEKTYLENDSKYMIVGGETCHPSSQSNCTTSTEELERFHWSFLNLDYHQGVLGQWKDEGCWDEITEKLGFRFELVDAHLQNEAKPNGKFNVKIKLINTGWANPSNPYDIQFNLRNTATQDVYSLILNDDLRKWSLGDEHILDVTVGIPDDIPLGNYDLSLVIKDGRQSLSFQPSFRIQMANVGTWNETLGENNLNHTLKISNLSSLPNYIGTNYFKKIGTPTIGFDGPKLARVNTFNDNAILYWTREKQSDDELVKIQRSEDNVNFQTIAYNNIDDVAYIDRHLSSNKTYYYRLQYVQDSKYSQITDISYTTPNATPQQFVAIDIEDNTVDDWAIVPPVATVYESGMVALKFMNTDTYLYFMLEAKDIDTKTYKIVLEMYAGEKFMISNGKLFHYDKDNDSWNMIKDLETNDLGDFVEGKVSLNDISFTETTSFTGSFTVNNNEYWQDKYTFQKYPSLSVPKNFAVVPSVVTPLSKTKLSWRLNTDANGYIIERSVGDDAHFELLKVLPSSSTYYLDKNLSSTEDYYYRMFAFNDIVKSENTDTKHIQLSTYTASDNVGIPHENVKIYPNPVSNQAKIELVSNEKMDSDIYLFDMNMKKIEHLYHGAILGKKTIAIHRKSLPAGVYFIKVQTPYRSHLRKIIFY